MTREPLRLLAIGVAYFLANKAALLFPDAERILAAVWPAAGIGLAALLLSPRRLWPGIALVVFLAGNLANLVSGRPLFNSLGFMAANILESLGCAWLMTRCCGGGVWFARTRDVLALLLAALAVNAVSALAGAGTAALAGLSPFWSFWGTWYVADGLGILLVTPLLVAWLGPRDRDSRLISKRWPESAVFLAGWTYVSMASLTPQSSYSFYTPQPYILVALLAWPALRLGFRTLTLALALLATIAILSCRLGVETLFSGAADPTQELLMVQVFVGCVAATAYFLSSAFKERLQAEAALRQEQMRLAGIIEATNVGTWEWNVQTGEAAFNEKWAQIVGYTLAELAPVSITTRHALAHPADFEFCNGLLQRHFAGELPYYDCECRMRHRDGRWVWVQDRGRVVSRTADGKPLLMFGTHQDITTRKAVEEALHEREANFRGFYESMTDMVWVVSPEGRILLANEAASRILGYHPGEFRAMPLLDLHTPDRREEAATIFAAMLRGEMVSCPLPLTAKDGRLVPVDTRFWRGNWQNGDCIFGISKDLSAEQEAQDRFKRIFSNNPAPMALNALDGRQFVDVNEAFVTTTGYERQEIIGRTANDLGLFPDPKAYQQATTELLAKERVGNFETLIRCKDGSQRHGVFFAEVLRGQRESHVLSVMVDITARKQAEFALQVREERMRRTFDRAPVGIFQADREGCFKYVNQKMCDIVGYTQEELIGLSFKDVTFPEDVRRDEELLQELFAGDDPTLVTQKRYLRRDGTLVWANRTAAPIRDRFGGLEYVIGIVEDITEKRQAEQFREDVEHIIRHDLKTPLAGVISIPYLLQDDDNLTAEQRSLLELVSASGRRMLHQINSSLELYKIESGIYSFEARACDPARLVRENASLLCTILETGHERFQVRDTTGLGPETALKTDPLLLDMALMNLLRNALEASNPGSLVGIDLTVNGHEYVIAISNNRPVPAEMQDRFFDKFATAGKQGGTGLGTYSAALMVKAMGGDIAMQTSDAEGTRVTVRLPLDA